MSSNQLAERKDPGNLTAGSNEVYNSVAVTLKAIRWSREKHVDSRSLRSQPSWSYTSLDVPYAMNHDIFIVFFFTLSRIFNLFLFIFLSKI